jgi:hypothetical protein
MKKFYCFLFVTILFTASCFAQSLTVSAKIVNSITYNTPVNMDFGSCAIGADVTRYKLGVDNSMTASGSGYVHVGSNLSGRIHFMGNPGDNASITVQMPSTLGGDATLDEFIYWAGDNAAYSGASPLTFANGSPFPATFNSNGDIYLSLGARLTVNKGATAPGSKSGTITITCIYQ